MANVAPHPYVHYWLERDRQADSADAAWRIVAREHARTISDSLVRDFGATRILLFGSVARDEAHVGSDIDLLVDGIAPERWFEACGAATELVPTVDVDLVPWAHCRAHVKARALAEGLLLHG
jgi:predicted nucleotidyltransferase